jgi:sodium transport system permease protein
MSTPPPGRARRDAIWLIAQKELREVLRDKRSLYVLVLLPIALYPALLVGTMLAATAQVRKMSSERHVVWVEGLEREPQELLDRLTAHRDVPPGPGEALADPGTPGALDDLPLTLTAPPVVGDMARYDAALSRGEVVAVLREHPGDDGRPVFDVLYNGGRDASTYARATLEKRIAAWRQSLVVAQVKAAGLSERALKPLDIASIDRGAKGALLARSLSALLVMLALTGAFYPALDMGAGEKERGTLETLLLAPVSRTTLATGKFIAVCTVSAACAVLHLCSLGLTFTAFGSFLPNAQSVTVPLVVVPAMIAVLLPLVALFSALALAASTFAASHKEGQAYLTPVLLVGMSLSMIAALPGIELTPTLALVPVAGASLLMKALLARTATIGQGVLVTGSSLAWAALAVRWVAGLYEREDVLLRPAAAGAPDLLGLRGRRLGEPGPEVPTLPQGIALGVGTVLLFVLVGVRIQRDLGLPLGIAVTLLGLVAMPALAYARLLGVDLRATFALRRPPALAVAGALLLALGAIGPVLDLHIAQRPWFGESSPGEQAQQARQMEPLLALPLPLLLVILGLLPGVCEEWCFRGFVLQAMRREGGAASAVLVSSTLFAIAHLDPSKLLGTFSLGVVLALVGLRSGSIIPCMLMHGVYDATAVTLQVTGAFEPTGVLGRAGFVDGDQPSWTWRLVSLGLLAAGAGAVWLSGATPAKNEAAPPAPG